jgi:hypothetical protein
VRLKSGWNRVWSVNGRNSFIRSSPTVKKEQRNKRRLKKRNIKKWCQRLLTANGRSVSLKRRDISVSKSLWRKDACNKRKMNIGDRELNVWWRCSGRKAIRARCCWRMAWTKICDSWIETRERSRRRVADHKCKYEFENYKYVCKVDFESILLW